MNRLFGLFIAFALLMPGATVQAGLSKADRKQAKALFQGTLYLRMDAPCATGRHVYGTYKKPLVEVSPEGGGDNAAENEVNSGWWHADSTYWGIRINDPVELDGLGFEKDSVEAELKGVDEAEGNATVIKLVGINSLDDLQMAFDHTFSRQPLQDEHDDWSPEVKQAIADRHLQDGGRDHRPAVQHSLRRRRSGQHGRDRLQLGFRAGLIGRPPGGCARAGQRLS